MRLIAHNLIRCVVAQTAIEHSVALERSVSKGTLDALRQFSQAMAQPVQEKAPATLGPTCSRLWPPIWSRPPGDESPAPSNVRKTNIHA